MSTLVAPASPRTAAPEGVPLPPLARVWVDAQLRFRIGERLASERVRVCLISALVLVPCFWQAHIQAGDLSSHLYNAWLTILIGQGKAAGLMIVPRWNNVLFDLMLSGLMRTVGPWGAEHIAVPLAVLIFVWGAFAMVCAVSGQRPWYTLTFIVMLAYGWVFHMGFMNFYLATGLSFWAFALLWKQTVRATLYAVPLLALAAVAHMMPVAWALGAAAYTWVARKILPRDRCLLTLGVLAALVVLRTFLLSHFPARWSGEQVISMTGADQMSVFESKYHPLEFMLLIVWLSLLLRLVQRKGEEQILLDIPFQLCAMISVAVLLLPDAVLLPGYSHTLRYVSARMSLIVGVSCCALFAEVAPGEREKTAIAVLMGLFFSFLYVDTRSLNYVEDLMEQSVAQMPSGARVISALCDQRRDVNLLAHTMDRVCIGRCFSYANDQPSSAQFRVRTLGANPIVAADYKDSSAMREGNYVVKPADEPLYQIYLHDRYIDTRLLRAGEVTGSTCFEVTPNPGSVFRRHTNGTN